MNRDNDKTFDASKVEGFSVSFALRARKELSNERKFEWSSGTLVLVGSFFLSPLFFFFLFFSYEKSNSQPVEENSKLKSNAFKNLFSAWMDALKKIKNQRHVKMAMLLEMALTLRAQTQNQRVY